MFALPPDAAAASGAATAAVIDINDTDDAGLDARIPFQSFRVKPVNELDAVVSSCHSKDENNTKNEKCKMHQLIELP